MVRRKGANWRKWQSLTILSGLALLMVTQYQNCETSEIAATAASSNNGEAGQEEASPVSVINDVKADAAVSFSTQKLEIHPEVESLIVDGQCSLNQEGALLGWKMRDSESNQEMERGFARCEQGRFQVELKPAQNLDCDHEYKVTARLGYGQEGEVKLERRCEPEAVADGASFKVAMQAAPDSQCQIERRPGQGTGCSVVCYSETGVVERENELQPSQCGL